MNRSFRNQLALRAALVMAAALLAISVVSVWTLGAVLDAEVDASILNVASIQAASLTDEPSGAMDFHEWELTPAEASSVRDLIRYAQVWSDSGVSLLRSRFMTSDLPVDRGDLDRAAEGELVWSEQVWEGRPIRTLYYPLERFGMAHQRHVLQVAAPLDARNALVVRAGIFFGLFSLVMTGATFAGGWWLADRAVRPVHEVIGQAEAIGAGSLDRRIQAYADTREYRRLVEVLNVMLGRIQAAFDAQRRFTADASHELRSPLTAMRGELELALRRERSSEEYRAVLESTLEEVQRLGHISDALLTLARSDARALELAREDVDLTDVAARVVARFQGRVSAKPLTLHLSSPAPARAWVDPSLAAQVVWNLVENAVRFTPPGGSVGVSVTDDGEGVVLAVEDTGPGFTPGEVGRVFERFYRADDARRHDSETSGTGLGLAIVHAVARAHGGEAGAENLDQGGAKVWVRFPRGIAPLSRSTEHGS